MVTWVSLTAFQTAEKFRGFKQKVADEKRELSKEEFSGETLLQESGFWYWEYTYRIEELVTLSSYCATC